METLLFVFALRLINPLDGPLGEEPGWRGFALPRLQGSGRSPLWATLLLALLVAAWHLPEVLVTQRLPPLGLLGAFAVTFWYSWLFNHTGGSAFMTLVMHAAEGTFGLAMASVFEGADLERAFSIYVAMTCLVAVALVAIERTAWRRPGSLEPRPTVVAPNSPG
jgi:membrane protease YdiL (CAAX protease family)